MSDQLAIELQVLIDKYGGHEVRRALERSEWGRAELERLLAITPHIMEMDKQRNRKFTDEIIELLTGGRKHSP